MQCVILAGGLATRMRPLTETIPKSLIPVAGRAFLDYQLQWMAGVGVDRVLLSVGYLGAMLRDYVGNGQRWGLAVETVDEGTELRGTAGALRLALDSGRLDEAFLVTYGDSFLPIDFARVWQAFQRCAKPALMTVLRNVGRWDQSNVIFEHGDVLYDKQRRTRPVADFCYIDYGLCALQRSLVLHHVPERGRADLANLFHELSLAGRLTGFEVHERFYEVGSPAGLSDFEQWVAART
jgi:NDP-sugar pyrophosphorylase family protein